MNDPLSADQHRLEYATSSDARNSSPTIAVVAVCVLSCTIAWLVAVEFAEEFPGGGYMLTPDSQLMVGIVIAILSTPLIVAVCYLVKRWLGRPRRVLYY